MAQSLCHDDSTINIVLDIIIIIIIIIGRTFTDIIIIIIIVIIIIITSWSASDRITTVAKWLVFQTSQLQHCY